MPTAPAALWTLGTLDHPLPLQIADHQGSKLHRRVNSKRIECVVSPPSPNAYPQHCPFPVLSKTPHGCPSVLLSSGYLQGWHFSPMLSTNFFSLLCMYRDGRSGCVSGMCAYREERRDRCESSLGIVVWSGLGDVWRLSAWWSEGRSAEEGRQEGWRKKADLKDGMKNKVSFCSKSAKSS